jgi:hypothetical protein
MLRRAVGVQAHQMPQRQAAQWNNCKVGSHASKVMKLEFVLSGIRSVLI